MGPDIRLRQAQHTDAASLAALAIQVWLDTYAGDGIHDALARYVLAEFTPASFGARIADPAQRVLVATAGPCLVGFAALRLHAPCPVAGGPGTELATLYVQRPFAGQGIGAQLFDAARTAAEAGAFWLAVNAQNLRALAFYGKWRCVRIGDTHFTLDGTQHLNRVLMTPPQA